ncbi:MAG TPA: MFS transporter, partial [Nodosilinea sp.]|nr:MFS transporter [Nodosilinea sp.]
TGYVANADTQPAAALNAIRLLIGPLPALLLGVGLWFCYRYPISRDRHQEILLALNLRRQQRFDAETAAGSDSPAQEI